MNTSQKLTLLNDFLLIHKKNSPDANYVFNMFILNQDEVLNQRHVNNINKLYIKLF